MGPDATPDPIEPDGPDRAEMAAFLRELATHVEVGAVSGVIVSCSGLLNGSQVFLDHVSDAEAGLLQHELITVLHAVSCARQPNLPEIG
jgi:hypothetical protein